MTANTITKASIALAAMIAAYVAVGAFFAHADVAPVITSTIRNTSDSVITTAHVGDSVHDVAQISSSTASTIPQGTVDFNVYANISCSGTASSVQGGVVLVNGFATSTATTTGATGLSYKVHYNGDNANIASDGPCSSLTITSANVTVSNALSAATITAGSNAHDSATLTNETNNAGGTLSYAVYSDASCQTPFAGGGNVNVTNGSVANSSDVNFPNAGSFYWQAVYHGDVNNNAATSSCALLTVQAVQNSKNNPTISTTLSSTSIQVGTSIHDSATLSGATANAGGSVSYKVFSNSVCSSLWGNAGSQAVTNSSVADSAPFQFNTAGTYYWQVVYAGDSNNNPATSTCANEVVTVVNQGSSTPVTTGNGTLSGEVFNDKNDNGTMDSGETGLAGFTVHLYQGTNFNAFAYDPIFKTAVTDANGNYSFSGLADGTYSVEQVTKNGWKQTTDDYTSVTVSGGTGQSTLNFGDVTGSKGKEKGHGTEKSHHGKGNGNGHKGQGCEGDDDADDAGCTSSTTVATSTHGWNFNINIDHSKGLHLGWFIGKGKQNSNKHSDK